MDTLARETGSGPQKMGTKGFRNLIITQTAPLLRFGYPE